MKKTFPAACAIISKSYLSDGRVLASSYLKHHPGARFYLLVVDAGSSQIEPIPGVSVIRLEQLHLPYLRELCFKYSPTELCCALKPTLLQFLLTKHNEQQLIYFDSDIMIMRRLDRLRECFAEADIVLTPHLLDPIPIDGLTPSEEDILVAGAYNLGFIAIQRSRSASEFLRWWERRLKDGGFIEFSQGLLTDQRWVDLVPSLFPAALLKDQTYNVAYWNIHSRPLRRQGNAFFVNEEPLSFFHFSGFDPAKREVFSKHQTRTRMEDGTALADLLRLYVDLQMQHGFSGFRQLKYGFRDFDNGVAITAPMRRVYCNLNHAQRVFFGDPFRASENSFFDWATRTDTISRALSPFLRNLYEMRPDVTAAFPDVHGKDRQAFLNWASTDGAAEYGYDADAMRIQPATIRPAAITNPTVKCSVIIPVFNNAALTSKCLDAVLNKTKVSFEYETILANDGSTDDTAAILKTYASQVRFVSHESNLGFARACNDAAAIADGEYLAFLNNDALPNPNWLAALVEYAEAHPEAAVVGSKLLFPNGTVQHAGIVICEDREPRHIYTGFAADDPLVNRSRKYQAVTAACMLVRRADFLKSGGFDAAFHNGYEDVDLCLRLGEMGCEIHYCHDSVLLHLESATRDAAKNRDHVGNSRLYRDRWANRVRPDEFEFYLRDELLNIDYRPIYPLAFSISPSLATANANGRDEVQAGRLIHARSNQVIGLMKDNIRFMIRANQADYELKRNNGKARRNGDGAVKSVSPAVVHSPRVISRGQRLWLSDQTTSRLVSIILPVKNGAAKLQKLLPALLSQKTRDLVEIVAVDSASSDASVELLRNAKATVIGIDPRTFNHGLTRNLATTYARGAIYVFLNQSTLPADEHWLANLVKPFDRNPSLAGVCGRMLPRPDADWLNAKDIAHNINASTEQVVTTITDRRAYDSLNPELLRRFVNFHSLSAAIRADVFKRIPFREANFAEDLIWGKDALEAGFTIQFEPSAVALHSHNYSVLDIFRRNFDDGLACHRICGRSVDEKDIVAAIVHDVRDDWRYLNEECRLQGDELEQWRLLSVLRRTAQLLGHWIGVHYEAAERHPEGLASILSITEQIKAGANTEKSEELVAYARSIG